MNTKGLLYSLVSTMVPAVLSVGLMPTYLGILGKEGLGLVATLALTLTVFGIFSTGAARLLQREMVGAATRHAMELQQVVRRGWGLYIGLAVAGMAIMGPLSYWASQGVQNSASELPPDQIGRCFLMMLGMAGLTFCYGYAGVILVALGHLAQASMVNLSVSVATAVLTVTMLQWWPRVDVFYACQFVILAGGVLAAVIFSRRAVRRACHDLSASGVPAAGPLTVIPLGSFLKQSLTLVAAEGLTVVICQMDRFLVSFLLPLSAMGSYSLGATMGRLVTMASGPLNLAVSPSICRLESGNHAQWERGEFLWRISFVATVILGAVCLPLWSASSAILHLWVRNPGLDVSEAVWVLRWLVLGNGLLALGMAFYNYTVACGDLKLGLILNLSALLILPVPGILAVRAWGLAGASLCWAVYGFAYLVISVRGARRCGLLLTGHGFWLKRTVSILLMTLLAGLSVHSFQGSDLAKVTVAGFASLAVVAAGLSCSFGFNPKAWKTALDIQPAP